MHRFFRLLLALCVVGGLTASLRARADIVVFRDTFTLNDQTTGCFQELSQHPPDIGIGWTFGENTSNNSNNGWKAADGRDWLSPCSSDGGLRVSYLAHPAVVLGPDYGVRFELADNVGSSRESFAGAQLRRTAVDTFYGFGMWASCYGAPAPPLFPISCTGRSFDTIIWKVVNGKKTTLKTGDINWFAELGHPANDRVEFGIKGRDLFVKRNGNVVMSVSDPQSSITLAGLPGLLGGAYQDSAGKPDTGMAYDTFEVVAYESGAPALRSDVTVEGVCGSGTLTVNLAAPPNANVPAGAQAGCRVTTTVR